MFSKSNKPEIEQLYKLIRDLQESNYKIYERLNKLQYESVSIYEMHKLKGIVAELVDYVYRGKNEK